MAKGKRTGKGHEQRYNSYKIKNQYAANRKARLQRALKKNPENKEIETALKSIVYRRSTPSNPEWSATTRKIAELFKLFTGKFDKNILHSNDKVAGPALFTRGPKSQPLKDSKVRENFMFSIRTRLESK